MPTPTKSSASDTPADGVEKKGSVTEAEGAAYSVGVTVGRRLALEEVLGELQARWSFNDDQQHTHSWHSREDYIELLHARVKLLIT